jgi:hypothetical protein
MSCHVVWLTCVVVIVIVVVLSCHDFFPDAMIDKTRQIMQGKTGQDNTRDRYGMPYHDKLRQKKHKTRPHEQTRQDETRQGERPSIWLHHHCEKKGGETLTSILFHNLKPEP